MTKYKILEINQDQGWVKIEVTFDDGEKYVKRMMIDRQEPITEDDLDHNLKPLSEEELVHSTVKHWLADYLPQRALTKQSVNLSHLKGKEFKLD